MKVYKSGIIEDINIKVLEVAIKVLKELAIREYWTFWSERVIKINQIKFCSIESIGIINWEETKGICSF